MDFMSAEKRTKKALYYYVLTVISYVTPITAIMSFISYWTSDCVREAFNDGIKEHVAFFSTFIAFSITITFYGIALFISKKSRFLQGITVHFSMVTITLTSAFFGVIVSVSFVHALFYTFADIYGLVLQTFIFFGAIILLTFAMTKSLIESKESAFANWWGKRVSGLVFMLIGAFGFYAITAYQVEQVILKAHILSCT